MLVWFSKHSVKKKNAEVRPVRPLFRQLRMSSWSLTIPTRSPRKVVKQKTTKKCTKEWKYQPPKMEIYQNIIHTMYAIYWPTWVNLCKLVCPEIVYTRKLPHIRNMSFQFLTIRVICSSSLEKPRQVSLFTKPSKCTYYRCMTIYPLKTTSAMVKAKRTWGCSSICEIFHSSFFRLSIPTSVAVWRKNLGPRPGSGCSSPGHFGFNFLMVWAARIFTENQYSILL